MSGRREGAQTFVKMMGPDGSRLMDYFDQLYNIFSHKCVSVFVLSVMACYILIRIIFCVNLLPRVPVLSCFSFVKIDF